MASRCCLCNSTSDLIAGILAICADCIRRRPEESAKVAEACHAATRKEFGLPPAPPRAEKGVRCTLCTNACSIGEGELGQCGLRTVRKGRLSHLAGAPDSGLVSWYDDPLPTNCVADWVCAGGRMGRTLQGRGKVNLAVFYESCTFNCLSCQNWHYRLSKPPGRVSAAHLASKVHRRTHCVCFFGGDPSSQMPHALASARTMAESGVTICWETNGSMHPRFLERAIDLSLATGGCIKFDIKALDDGLHRALTGVSNQAMLDAFRRAARRGRERVDPPLVVASTLLVPGYVDADQVGRIAQMICGLDPSIPYALLGFHPQFLVPDLPHTSVRHADEAEAAARAAGLARVRVGNRQVLGRAY